MCKVIMSMDEKEEQLDFIVYNMAFSEKSGKFTIESIINKLLELHIVIERFIIQNLLNSWVDMGILFDNEEEYIINSALI
ncbi:MAG: hypothetical protein K0S41_495 [Anaerocolumna sp.]|nr:hypothetical protein [Anaerocolumna sp.]